MLKHNKRDFFKEKQLFSIAQAIRYNFAFNVRHDYFNIDGFVVV